jgi:hypothetical protein
MKYGSGTTWLMGKGDKNWFRNTWSMGRYDEKWFRDHVVNEKR